MPRLLLTAIAAAAALAASGPALADDSYELSIGYQLDTSRSGDIGDMRHLESNAIDKYELCAQGVHVGQDQGGLRGCEVAFRKAISSIPHTVFQVTIQGPGGKYVTTLTTLSVDDATSTDFDRNLYHLAANNRYWPTGLVAHPGPRCDVRIASTGAAAEPPAAVCVALERYFQDRLYEALVLHSDDAFGLIAAGTKTGSPLAIALNFPGMTAQYAQRLVMAGSSVRGALQAEVNWPRSRARTVSGCVLVSTGATVCPVQHPNMENVQALLAAGDSVDERTLEMAATSGNAEVLRLLAERIQDKTRSPEVLRLAIGYGPSALVEALLQAGWSANAGLGTPERFAVNPCSGLCIPIQVALVGADAAGDALLGPPFRTANERMTYEAQAGTWMSSARRADLTRMVSALFAHGAVLKDYDPVELYDAVYYDDGAAVVKLLLDHGATARARYQYKDGLHGLLWVAHHTLYSGFDGDPQVLELLRTHGAQN